MIARVLLWLAEFTDRWARRAAKDDAADRLAQAESEIECWEIEDGQFLDRDMSAPVTYLDEHVERAMRRHPAKGRRA